MIRSDLTRGRARRVLGRSALALLAAALLLWSAGFLWFVESVSRAAPKAAARVDAVVVLTGGKRRLNAGLDLLVSGHADRMLVSGVNSDVTADQLREIVANSGAGVPSGLFECCVELGFRATDTRGNAAETATWARRHGVRSLLLVTSNYHMARSLFEFAHALPDARIEPHPVIAENVILDEWWRWPGSIRLLAIEYHKLIAAAAWTGTLEGLRRSRRFIGQGLRDIIGPQGVHRANNE